MTSRCRGAWSRTRWPGCVLGAARWLCRTAGACRPGGPPARATRRTATSGRATPSPRSFGHFGGSGGRFGIGPHSGKSYGVRYDIRTGGTVQLGLGFARGRPRAAHRGSVRRARQPHVRARSTRRSPSPRSNSSSTSPAGRPGTGWRPFVGAGVGLTFPSGTPADTSGFEFGQEVLSRARGRHPDLPHRRLHLRAEARATFWKLKYPADLRAGAAGGAGHRRRLQRRDPGWPDQEWTATPGSRSGSATPSRSERWRSPSPASSGSVPCTGSTGPTGREERNREASARSRRRRAMPTTISAP